MARSWACRTVGFESPRSHASRRSSFTFSRLATGSGGYPLSCRAQVSTFGLTSAGVEVLIIKLYPIFSALGNSRNNQDLEASIYESLIGIYIFYENWSTETFRMLSQNFPIITKVEMSCSAGMGRDRSGFPGSLVVRINRIDHGFSVSGDKA